jgi:hypothetical protein
VAKGARRMGPGVGVGEMLRHQAHHDRAPVKFSRISNFDFRMQSADERRRETVLLASYRCGVGAARRWRGL